MKDMKRKIAYSLVLLFVAHPLFSWAQEQFPTPQAAVNALVEAAKARNLDSIHAIFGRESLQLVSHDPVQASNSLEVFLGRTVQKAQLCNQSSNCVEVDLGLDAWPLPIPLVNQNGEWHFDISAGREEILNRRIGMNELAAIRVCHAYVAAQREYAAADRNGDGVLEYAVQLRSTPGRHNGLYWHANTGDEMSPLGPLIAQAHEEGYRAANKIMAENNSAYRGYCFKILTRQGRHAVGGKYNYIINGHMIAGFALVAWPSQWGNTGIMTFVVNQQDKVFQKNLGPRSYAIAESMSTFDPGAGWTAVSEP